MQKESDDSIVYVPTMHREFFPEGFSGCVKPLWPGLSSRYWGQRNPDAWHKISLPYTPTEAAACLAELTQLDEAGIAALSDTAASSRSTAQKVSQERDDLKCFAKTGECREAGKDTVSTEDMRRWAQRFLLLGWLQEERVWRWSSSRRVIARGRRNWRPTWARGIPRGNLPMKMRTCFPACLA